MGTGLRKAINSLISPTKTGASALGELGLSTKDFTDNKGNMKSMTDIFGLLHDKMQGLGKNKQTDIFHDLFGTTGQQAGLILAENAKQLGELNQKVADSAKNDYVGKLSKKNSETGKVALDRLKQSVNAITMTISSAALPAITEIGDKLAKAAGTKEFENAVKGVGKWVGNLTDKVADFFTYLGKHSDDLKGITGSLGTIVKDIAKGAWDTFYGIIKGIGKAFNLVHTNGKKAEDPLKVLNQFVSGIAKHEQALKTIGGLLAGIWVADKVAVFTSKVKDVTDAFGGLSKKLKNSEIQNAASEVGEKTGENLTQGITSKMDSGAIESKGSALGLSLGTKLSIGATAVLAGMDIVGAIKAKTQTQKVENIGGAIGTAIGGGIGAYFGQPVLGAMIGQALGKLGGLGASNFLTGYNDYLSKHKPKNIVQKIGYNFAQAKEQWSKNMTSLKKYHPVLHFLIKIPISAFKNKLGIITSVGRAAMNGLADLWDIGKDSFMGRFDKIIPDVKKNFSNMIKGIQTDWKNIWNPKNIKKPQATHKSSKSQTHKTSITSTEIKKVASQKSISKKDIENVKMMAGAVKKYQVALNSLKSSLKSSGITKDLDKLETNFSGTYKSLNKMIKPFGKVTKNFNSLSKFKIGKNDPFKTIKNDLNNFEKYLKKSKLSKYINDLDKIIKKSKLSKDFGKLTESLSKDTKKWDKFSKPIEKVSKSFKTLNSFTNSFAKSMKKDPFKGFNRDLKNLEATLKKSKISNRLGNLYKQLKKDRLYNQFDKMSDSIKDNTKTWTKFAKPIRDVQKAFKELNKFTKTYSKSDPFANLNKDIQNLTKTLNSNDIGKILKSQITEANKATTKVTFDTDFKNLTDNIVDALKSFKTNFDKSWKDVWANTGSEEKDALAKVVSNYSSKMNAISKKETSFSSDYLNKWSSWLKSVKSSFKTAFNSLPGLASKSLSKVISEVNKGIGGVNSVITDFGGKSLNLAKYAVGTAGTPGGNLAVVGEQGYELAYDKANGIYPVGLKGEEVRYLGTNTAILPHHLSEQFMGMVANLPHHANGKGDTNKTSEDMTDYIFEHLDELKKDPVPFLKKPYFEKANFSGNEFISRFGNAISNGFLKAIAEPFKKTLADMDFSGAGGARPAKAYGPMIKAAAAYMHQKITDFNVDMIERIIGNESGGNPHAINLTDNNAKAGTPSKGILQYIDPTFNNYAMPGHKNIWNPLDQLIALFNDATWRTDMGMGYNGKYGEWRGSASGPSGPRFMYDGGFINKPTSIIGGEAGPEVMIPLNNKMRAVQILQKAKDTIGGPDDTNVTASVDTTRVESNQQQQLMMTQIMVKLLSKIADGSMASDVSNGGTSLNDISNALDKIGLSNRKMTKFQGKGGTAFA